MARSDIGTIRQLDDRTVQIRMPSGTVATLKTYDNGTIELETCIPLYVTLWGTWSRHIADAPNDTVRNVTQLIMFEEHGKPEGVADAAKSV